jgi:xanthine dehydrogenase accessory factor
MQEKQASGSDPLETALSWRDEGRDVALATVVQTWGSAPQPVGSRLVIDGKGNFEGSVSGGCVEGAVIVEAEDVIASGKPRLLTFGVSDETAFEAGLACGGTIRVFVERLESAPEESNAALYKKVISDRAGRRPAVLVTDLATGAQELLHRGDEGRRPALADSLSRAFAGSGGAVVPGEKGELFLDVHLPPLQLIVIGAVHIAQHLAPLAVAAGYAVTIVDPRQAFATRERFPEVRLIAEWPDEVLPDFALDEHTAMVLLTHDPKIDDVALKAALASDCFYIGALGSKRTHAARRERLLEAGISEQALARIHAPIGLDIGATGPVEIAVSIMAEITAVLRLGRDGADAL